MPDGVRIEAKRRRLLWAIPLPVAVWAGQPGGGSAALRVLTAAVENRQARDDETSILLSHPAAAALPASIAGQINMPPPSQLSVQLSFDGRIDTADAAIRARWFDARRRPVLARRTGAFAEVGDQTTRLSSALYRLLEA